MKTAGWLEGGLGLSSSSSKRGDDLSLPGLGDDVAVDNEEFDLSSARLAGSEDETSSLSLKSGDALSFLELGNDDENNNDERYYGKEQEKS
jgi:hypothetical protein